MPDEPSSGQPENQEPREQDFADLRDFVSQLRSLLQAIVEDGRHIPDTHLASVREAWPHALADLIALHNAIPQTVGEESVENLHRKGLTGAPLRMKLRAWRSRLFAFGRRMNRRWLRSTLRWADSILGSLVNALPGAGAAAKEFKEAIENFLEDAEADGKPELRRGTSGR